MEEGDSGTNQQEISFIHDKKIYKMERVVVLYTHRYTIIERSKASMYPYKSTVL